MELRIASSVEELQAYRESWEALHARCDTAALSSWLPWVVSWYEAFAAQGGTAAWLFFDEGELVGAIPLYSTVSRRGGVSLTMLRSAMPEEIPGYEPLLPDATRVLPAFCSELRRRSGSWDVVHLRGVPTDTALWRELPQCARAEGLGVLAVEKGESHVIPMASSYDDWLAKQARHRSYTVKDPQRRLRRLQRQGAVEYRVRRGAEGLDGFLSEFVAIEASTWKGGLGTAMRSQEDVERFYRLLLARAGRADALSVFELHFDGRMISAWITVTIKGTCHLLRTAYAQDMAQYTPGINALLHGIRHCHEAGDVAQIDYGDCPIGSYKTQWYGRRRSWGDVYVFGRSVRARLAHATTAALYRLRRSERLYLLYWKWRMRDMEAARARRGAAQEGHHGAGGGGDDGAA